MSGAAPAHYFAALPELDSENLTGIDPFIDVGIDSNGVNIIKSDIQDINGEFDLIMFNHSFEHVMVARRNVGGCTPSFIEKWTVFDSDFDLLFVFVDRTSSNYWVQLDAPRHIVVFSREGFSAWPRA